MQNQFWLLPQWAKQKHIILTQSFTILNSPKKFDSAQKVIADRLDLQTNIWTCCNCNCTRLQLCKCILPPPPLSTSLLLYLLKKDNCKIRPFTVCLQTLTWGQQWMCTVNSLCCKKNFVGGAQHWIIPFSFCNTP